MLVRRFRRAGGAVSDKHARFATETDCQWIRNDPGGDKRDLPKSQKGDWWKGATSGVNREDASDCHIITEDVYMCGCP